MRMKVDGGCRNNGYHGAVAAAAVVLEKKHRGGRLIWTQIWPEYPTPTNQRAELTAIILALEKAVERADELHSAPYLIVTISTDSKYAQGCMTDWSYKWRNNGWINAAGGDVVNQDLVKEALGMEASIEKYGGKVEYIWVPRADNEEADAAVNKRLDEECGQDYQSSSEEDW